VRCVAFSRNTLGRSLTCRALRSCCRYGAFLWSGESLNLDEIGEHVDTMVGVVLVAMGFYGLAQVRVL
jgi:hypothetical protein